MIEYINHPNVKAAEGPAQVLDPAYRLGNSVGFTTSRLGEKPSTETSDSHQDKNMQLIMKTDIESRDSTGQFTANLKSDVIRDENQTTSSSRSNHSSPRLEYFQRYLDLLVVNKGEEEKGVTPWMLPGQAVSRDNYTPNKELVAELQKVMRGASRSERILLRQELIRAILCSDAAQLSRNAEVLRSIFDKYNMSMLRIAEKAIQSSSWIDFDHEVYAYLQTLCVHVRNMQTHVKNHDRFAILVQLAFSLGQLRNLNARLDSLLENGSFSRALVAPVTNLSTPKIIYAELARAANSPAIAQRDLSHILAPKRQLTSTLTSHSIRKKLGVATVSTAAQPATHNTKYDTDIPYIRGESPIGALSNFIRPFSDPNLPQVSLDCVTPVAKKKCLILLQCLLQNTNPTARLEIYYDFGYSTCSDNDQIQKLGGLYLALMKTAAKPDDLPGSFEIVWKAFERGSLVEVFDEKQYDVRGEIPHLAGFLTAPENRRPTVWRLTHFLQATDNTRATDFLKTRWGFMLCSNPTEIELLKNIYRAVLMKADPLAMDEACLQGRLLDFCKRYTCIAKRHERFFRNVYYDYPVLQVAGSASGVASSSHVQDSRLPPLISSMSRAPAFTGDDLISFDTT